MKPSSEDELAGMIASAGGPVRICGGGTRGLSGAGEVLQTGGMSGIVLHEPGALTLVAKAGTPLAEVEAVLEGADQRLPFEPMDARGLLESEGVPTVGGMAAANVSGPRRIQAGACRDYMLGVRFVDGAGRVVSNGGRVMKNVTGYDLVKLMAGSFGTLGVLTEVAFKVLPKPAAQAMLVLEGLSVAEAVAAMSRALGSAFDVTGAAHDPLAGRTLLRIEGFEGSVDYRAERLQALLAGRIERDVVVVEEAWRGIRDVAPFHGRAGDVWRISCKPSDAPEVAARLGGDLLLDWGGGLVWALLPTGTDARAALAGIGGHATLVRGASQPRFAPQPEAVAAIAKGLQARFDPRGILNPGLMA
ncbi:FAD-binding protein [Salipiger sp. 1_MG-2023]|uniref:FAD-binding protein n=1 Tax=Salipiger sp. 1_MG-2023 TaxID=3062665 RepID=UPI0026E3DA36|nr:FAD-binding protein [Salipiger sp. 1_MG-2023]MDO6584874.1 FAD-binding protein [Salipiger sp. 1_MG-2023]